MVEGISIVQKKGNKAIMQKRLLDVSHRCVYVGIPQAESSRPGQPITNAELLYIHTHGVRNGHMIKTMNASMSEGMNYSDAYDLYLQSHGSPRLNIPPRPVIQPAIEAHEEEVADMVKDAVKSYMMRGTDVGYKKLGVYAKSLAINWFDDPRNNWAPNAAYTVQKKGSDKPLVDTASMKNSITYVLDKEYGG